jgi:hypothetical protein
MYVFPNIAYWSKCREQANVFRTVKYWCAQRLWHDGSNTVTNVGTGRTPSRDYAKSHQAASYLQAPRDWENGFLNMRPRCRNAANRRSFSRNVKCSLIKTSPVSSQRLQIERWRRVYIGMEGSRSTAYRGIRLHQESQRSERQIYMVFAQSTGGKKKLTEGHMQDRQTRWGDGYARNVGSRNESIGQIFDDSGKKWWCRNSETWMVPEGIKPIVQARRGMFADMFYIFWKAQYWLKGNRNSLVTNTSRTTSEQCTLRVSKETAYRNLVN